ncbi:MAG: NADH-quinone oxidoreductase subunit J [candidate division Zixibacteria bacterium]|nr:NADH-quinone oxidoreductase subunit J [candidate division Zixibacteria bacterium]
MGIVVFYMLAAAALASAIMVVTRKNAVTSAIYLVVAMCCIAGLFVQLGSIFIGVLQIIVYAGAIIVLFLFVIMMLNLKYDELGFDSRVFQRIFSAVLSLVLILQLVLAVSKYPFKPGRPIDMSMGNVENVAHKLFYDYLYPFEVTGVLLLAAIIGAVVIARKKGNN